MDSLFPDEPDLAPQAARLAPRLRGLAAHHIYYGTSSWKYEGWLGSVYSDEPYKTRGKHSKAKFDRECLAEYARVFPTVCGDFAFYQFPTQEYWDGLFDQVPAGFTFGLKVPEDITVSTWPSHKRYGTRAGLENENFLNAKAFERYFLKRLEKHKEQLGPLIIEFGTFNKKTFPTTDDFMASLDPFLAALPEGFHYSVELRNPEYLSPEYFALLAGRNVAHVFNAWTRMPALDDQAQLDDALSADFTVVRALLKKGRGYEDAVDNFQPYDRIREPNEGAREGIREIVRKARARKIPAWVFVNNRLEGNAPGTIEALVGEH